MADWTPPEAAEWSPPEARQPGVTPAPPNAKPREYAPIDPAPDSQPDFLARATSRMMAAQRGAPLPSHTAPNQPSWGIKTRPDAGMTALRTGAQLGEFATTELFGMVGSAVTSGLGYGFARLEGKSREEASKLGLEFGAEHSDAASPVYRPLTSIINAVAGQATRDTPVDLIMHKVTDLIKSGGDKAEASTSGAVKSGEVQLLVNALFARLATKGINRMTTRWDGKGPMPKEVADKFEVALQEEMERTAAAKETKDAAPKPFKKQFPALAKSKMVDQYGKPLAVAAGVGIGAYALAGKDEETAALAAAAIIPFSKRIEAVREALPEGDPLRGKLDAAAVGGPSALPHLDALRMELYDRGAPREVLARVDEATKSLEALQEGTVELPTWVVGAPLAINAGQAVVEDRKKPGKPYDTIRAMGVLTVAGLAKLPEATPIGAISPRMRYTTRFLERVSERYPGTWDFSIKQLRQELSKSGASAGEREVFEKILEGKERITAKELVGAFKVATGDFELTPKTTGEHAPYGLERIDRVEMGERLDAMPGEDPMVTLGDSLPPSRTIIYQSPITLGSANHFSDPNYFAHTRSFDEGGVRHVVEVQSDLAQKAGKTLTAEQRAGLERGVETLQADILKYTALRDRLVPGHSLEVRASTMDALRGDLFFADAIRRGENNPAFMLNRVIRQIEVQIAENQSKLRSAASIDSIAPLLPDWYKRIVREEVVEAARASPTRIPNKAKLQLLEAARLRRENFGEGPLPEDLLRADKLGGLSPAELEAKAVGLPDEVTQKPVMRFATADTVAKVEGWPRGDVFESSLRRDLARAEELYRETADPTHKNNADYARERLERHLAARGDQVPGFSPQHQLIYDRYRGGIEKFLKSEFKARPYTDSHGHTWLEIDLPSKPTPTRMLGVAAAAGTAAAAAALSDDDSSALSVAAIAALPAGKRVSKLRPALIALGAGAGITALLSDEENRLRDVSLVSAVIGLAVATKSGNAEVARWAGEAALKVEQTVGNVSAEVRSISEPLLRRLTRHEANVLVKTHRAIAAVSPFVEALRDMPENVRKALGVVALTGDREAMTRLIAATGDKTLIADWPKVTALLDEYGVKLKKLGLIDDMTAGYYPRVIADLDGLLRHLGGRGTDVISKALTDAARKKAKVSGEDLTDVEVAAVVNRHLVRAINASEFPGKPGLLKGRRLREITEELLPYYAPASESLPIYLRAATKEIERAEFFGKNLLKQKGSVNLSGSIGNLIATERAAGKLSHEQLQRIESILRSRFGPGERSMSPTLQAAKNTTQALLLGNPFSAITQFGDAAVAVALHGFLPTIKGMATRGGARWTLADLGLVNHLTEEFVHGTRRPMQVGGVEISTAKFLEKALKYSFFNFVDEFSKSVNINAAAQRFQSLARTKSGQLEIMRRYGEYFGNDTGQLISDLSARKKSPLVGELLFRELSDVQPISKLEMPQGWLASPETRILYTLKSFMIKQMNLVRERGFREIANGNAVQGTAFLLRYSLALGISGATTSFIINWLRGRDDKLDWADIPENALKTFGWSSYVIDQARKGKPIEAAVGTALPPYKLYDDILRGDKRAIQYIPLVGKPLYDHFFGGAEEHNAKQAKKERAKEMAVETPAERRARKQELESLK